MHSFSVSFVFWGVEVVVFGVFLLCLLNNQAYFYSTARYLELTTAEKGPFVLPPLLSHLLSPPRGSKSLSQEKHSTAGAQEQDNQTAPPRPSEHILVSKIPQIPSLMF